MILTDTQIKQLVDALFDSQSLDQARDELTRLPGWREAWPSLPREYDSWSQIVRRASEIHAREVAAKAPSSLLLLIHECLVDEVQIRTFQGYVEAAAVPAPAAAGAIPRHAWLKVDRAAQKGELDLLLGPVGGPLLVLSGARTEAHWNLCRRLEQAESWPCRAQVRAVPWFGTPCQHADIVETLAKALAVDGRRWDGGDLVALIREACAAAPQVLCMGLVPDPVEDCFDALRELYVHELPALCALAGQEGQPAPLQIVQPVISDDSGEQLMAQLLDESEPAPSTLERLRRLAPGQPDPAAWVRGLRDERPFSALTPLAPISLLDVQRWANVHVRDHTERARVVAGVTKGSTSKQIYQILQAYNEERSR